MIRSGREVKKKEDTEGTGDDDGSEVGWNGSEGGRGKREKKNYDDPSSDSFSFSLFVCFFFRNDAQKNPVDVFISESHVVLVNPHVS